MNVFTYSAPVSESVEIRMYRGAQILDASIKGNPDTQIDATLQVRVLADLSTPNAIHLLAVYRWDKHISPLYLSRCRKVFVQTRHGNDEWFIFDLGEGAAPDPEQLHRRLLGLEGFRDGEDEATDATRDDAS